MKDVDHDVVGARFIAPALRDRKALRLKHYDYTKPGAYFVTVCCEGQRCALGEVCGDDVVLNAAGRIVLENWSRIPERFLTVALDAFVLMPNHLHGILRFEEAGAMNRAPTLGEVVRSFKASVTRASAGVVAQKFWQRGFHERVVRNDAELDRIREYITNNPRQWSIDRENPDCSLN